MTCTLKPGKFVCSSNFIPLDGKSVLNVEDLDDDDMELWIIQAPVGVDMKKFNNHSINCEGSTFVSIEENKKNNWHCLATEYSNINESGFQLVLPRKSDEKLCCVSKHFKGHLLITEQPDLSKFNLRSKEKSEDISTSKDLNHEESLAAEIQPISLNDPTSSEDQHHSTSERQLKKNKRHSNKTKDRNLNHEEIFEAEIQPISSNDPTKSEDHHHHSTSEQQLKKNKQQPNKAKDQDSHKRLKKKHKKDTRYEEIPESQDEISSVCTEEINVPNASAVSAYDLLPTTDEDEFSKLNKPKKKKKKRKHAVEPEAIPDNDQEIKMEIDKELNAISEVSRKKAKKKKKE